MDFNPPASARFITAAQLDAMPVPEEKFCNVPVYGFDGPLFIKGDIAHKKLAIAGGGVWIDGNVKGCSINVYPKDYMSLTGDTLWPTLKQLAADGIGAHISGSAESCTDIIAPNISIGKNLKINALPITEGDNIVVPGNGGAFNAAGGYFHVGGDVIGNPDAASTMRATSNILIGGDAENVELTTETGQTTVLGKQKGVTVCKENSDRTVTAKISLDSKPKTL